MPGHGGEGARVESPRVALPRVLVVDDEPAIRGLIAEVLGTWLDVDEAGSAEEAMERLGAREYQAVLCDFWLPKANGRELYAWVCAHCPERAACMGFMTGDAHDSDARAFFEETGAPALPKPFKMSDLTRLVRVLLGLA